MMRSSKLKKSTSAYKLVLILCSSVMTSFLGHAQVGAVRPPQDGYGHGVAEMTGVMTLSQILSLPPDTVHHHVPEEEDESEAPAFPLDPSVPFKYDTAPTPSSMGAMGVLSPSPASNFTGLSVSSSIPPDVQGAAGSSYLMQAVNDHVRILNKSGTTTSTTTPSSFFTSLSPSNPFDPRVAYDPYSQRWILLYDDFSQSTSSSFLLAVSATSDPTGTWYFYKIRADSTGTNWLDFPMIGFNKNWIIVSGNMYTVSGNTFAQGKVWAISKSDVYAHGSGSYTYFTRTYGGIQPASTYDSNLASEFLSVTYNPTSAALLLLKITGSVGSESMSSVGFLIGSTAWSFSPSSTNFAPQQGSTNKIDLDDSRIQSVVVRNNYVWMAQTIFLPSSSPTRASIQWWVTDTTGSTYQHAFIDDSTGTNFYAYPSIAVNSYNDAMIGYSSFSSSQYASSNYSFRYSCDDLSTMESTYLYKAGQNTYYEVGTGTANRWGDYSATVVDPSNDVDFWTIQEYASSTVNDWSSWWAKVTPTHTNGGSGTWTWTGGRSTSWFEPCNWDKGTLPDGSSDVVIPGGTTYAPTITGAAGSCNTITIATASGGVLNIDDSGGGSLSISQ